MKKKNSKWKYAVGIMLFMIINLLLKLFVVDVFKVHGYSMYPTLNNGSYVFASKLASGVRMPRNVLEIPWLNNVCYYLFPNEWADSVFAHTPNTFKRLGKNTIERNDVVVFNMPYYLSSVGVKRCLGMPGDSIGLYSEKKGLLSVIPYEGMRLDSKLFSLSQQDTLKTKFLFIKDESNNELVATMNFYFLQGDNVESSIDSRMWGLLPEDHIIAKVLFTLF